MLADAREVGMTNSEVSNRAKRWAPCAVAPGAQTASASGHQHRLDGDGVVARPEMPHRHLDRQVAQDFAARGGDRHGRGDVVVDIDVDMAARQHLLRIGGVEQDRRLAIGLWRRNPRARRSRNRCGTVRPENSSVLTRPARRRSTVVRRAACGTSGVRHVLRRKAGAQDCRGRSTCLAMLVDRRSTACQVGPLTTSVDGPSVGSSTSVAIGPASAPAGTVGQQLGQFRRPCPSTTFASPGSAAAAARRPDDERLVRHVGQQRQASRQRTDGAVDAVWLSDGHDQVEASWRRLRRRRSRG